MRDGGTVSATIVRFLLVPRRKHRALLLRRSRDTSRSSTGPLGSFAPSTALIRASTHVLAFVYQDER